MNSTSIADIYKQHSSLVFNLALQYTQNTEDAEEITQDVFLQVHHKLESFKKESELKTWIYRITVNKSLDFLRARKAKKRWSIFSAKRIDDEQIQLPDTFMNHPGVELEQKEALKNLFSIINRLPEKQKTVIILLKVDFLSMKETAEIMELSYKAVESLYQRAKKNLKELIKSNEGK